MTALTTDNLTLAYEERTIVDGVSLEIPAGQVTSIIGPNGCGKSTLLKSMARVLRPVSGSVLLDGVDVHALPHKRYARTVGLLPQSPVAPAGLAVADLVGRGRTPHQGLFGRWNSADHRAVDKALEATNLTELAERSIEELSGGQRQRAWIAMVLAQDTEVLLLDEPTTFLDVSAQLDVLDLLTELNREQGTTIVMVLHDMNLAARYSDHLIALNNGRVLAEGSAQEVMTPAHLREVFGLNAQVLTDPVSDSPLVSPIGRYHVKALLP